MVTEGGVTAKMIVAQFVEVGGDTLMKSATKDGMSIFIFIVYSNLLALFFSSTIHSLPPQEKSSSSISTSIFCRIFVLGCLRTATQTLMASGIRFSSPTLASAMVDIVPAYLHTCYNFKTWIVKDYPEELVITTICCCFVVIISTIIALIAEGNSNAWRLKPDKELLSVCYSAAFVVSLRNVLNTWACRKKGPIYVATFNRLRVVIALGMGLMFLGDNLYLGSVIGAAIRVIGFYAVIWAKAQEEHTTSENNFLSSSSTPF